MHHSIVSLGRNGIGTGSGERGGAGQGGGHERPQASSHLLAGRQGLRVFHRGEPRRPPRPATRDPHRHREGQERRRGSHGGRRGAPQGHGHHGKIPPRI